MNTDSRTIVIGGGLGGLAAACTLAARGLHVTLFEAGPHLGGKAAVLRQDGFTFDLGPTILTMPSVLERIFREAGQSLAEALPMVALDPQWRCFFPDGGRLDLTANVEAMSARLREFSACPQDAEGYREFHKLSRRLHDISDDVFFWKSVGGLGDVVQPSRLFDLEMLRKVLALRMGRSVASTIRGFVGDARVAQMLDHFTQYIGSAPNQSPAVLCGIAHMQTSEGIWFPRGGIRAVAEALVALAESLGVELHTQSPVRRIDLTARGEVAGATLEDGSSYPARMVVSNSDCVRMHTELLPREHRNRFRRRRRYEPACSGVVLYLGLRERYPQLAHHNFVFSQDAHAEFEAIYETGIPAPDPTCYVCAPAATNPDVAPPGGEALYVLVHTPYLRDGHDWTKIWPEYRPVILNTLARTAGLDDLESRIRVERVYTPHDIEQRYRTWRGAIYGLASHGLFRGAFKPANRHPSIRGLYLAGGSVHPGPGMPMALMSGWIAADTLCQDLNSGVKQSLAPRHPEPQPR